MLHRSWWESAAVQLLVCYKPPEHQRLHRMLPTKTEGCVRRCGNCVVVEQLERKTADCRASSVRCHSSCRVVPQWTCRSWAHALRWRTLAVSSGDDLQPTRHTWIRRRGTVASVPGIHTPGHTHTTHLVDSRMDNCNSLSPHLADAVIQYMIQHASFLRWTWLSHPFNSLLPTVAKGTSGSQVSNIRAIKGTQCYDLSLEKSPAIDQLTRGRDVKLTVVQLSDQKSQQTNCTSHGTVHW